MGSEGAGPTPGAYLTIDPDATDVATQTQVEPSAYLNTPAKVVAHARGIILRRPRSYAYFDAFVEALARIRLLPYFA